MARGQKQRDYEFRQSNERNAVPDPTVPTCAELREYIGEDAWARIGTIGSDDDPVDTYELRKRYFALGGLTLFLSDGFPNSTSMKPFGPGQLRAIDVIESVIRNGGVEQSLEPRAFGKSSRVARAAIWALLGGFRRCGTIFQSSEPKAVETLSKIKNELAGSPFLRALSPGICAAVKHITHNPGLSKRQHYQDELTNIQWLKGSIRLPDILGETGGGARLLVMPFSKAAGISLSDPITLEDLRPDLLLPDDVQSHDDCGSPRITEKLLSIWGGSVKYLGGRGKTPATVFTQTIFECEDMADKLSKDPSIHTVKYEFLESFPDEMDWWKGPYRQTLLGYDQNDPEGQSKAREAANELYRKNQKKADKGAKVSWEHAYDEESCVSAIQQAMNNFLTDEVAFWAQDQNDPSKVVPEGDIRCPTSRIVKKMHPEPRSIVPEFANRLVCHIDVQDSLLYYAVCAGSSSMQMGMIDRQTFPPQKQHYFTLRQAHIKFDECCPGLATKDQITAALTDLVKFLQNSSSYSYEDGTPAKIDVIGIDTSDGDHFDTIHAFCRNNPGKLIPVQGIAPSASETPMNARKKGKSEKKRGDHWVEKLAPRTKQRYVSYDVGYWKTKLHEGLRQPIGTSESVSLFHAENGRTHDMTADHCNSETVAWTTATKENDVTSGCWKWTHQPSKDNHIFDNLTGCMMLLSYEGGSFASIPQKKKRKRWTVEELKKLSG
ncbi:MAG TPA: hypothetical protein DDW52_13470 [Planctomycetaceae bacterium]|nr:hypothetical protein [Planctomycetaceae bacterium]